MPSVSARKWSAFILVLPDELVDLGGVFFLAFKGTETPTVPAPVAGEFFVTYKAVVHCYFPWARIQLANTTQSAQTPSAQ